jgi:hypothetical protein
LETLGKRSIESANTIPARALAAALYDSDIYQIQPLDELPVGVIGFDDRENIYKTFKLGFEDARRGFVPYTYGSE